MSEETYDLASPTTAAPPRAAPVAEHWRLALQGNPHEIPESDYKRVEALIRRVARS